MWFEDSWDNLSRKEVVALPRNSKLVLDVQVTGQPSFMVPIARYKNIKWHLPAEGQSFNVTPDEMLLTWNQGE